MTNTGRKKRRKNAVVTMAFRLFFVLLLLSMLAAYISNQVTISSKRAEHLTNRWRSNRRKIRNCSAY